MVGCNLSRFSLQGGAAYPSSDKKGGITLQVKIKIYGDINYHLPAGSSLAEMNMQPINVLRDLINSLRIPQYAIWLIKINGQEVNLDHRVESGDTIEIYATGGGA